MARTHLRSRRRGLFIPFLMLALIVAGWTAFWLYMRTHLDESVDKWVADQRAAGVEVTYQSRAITGYPFRYALTLGDPRMSDPNLGYTLAGERFELVMQPWDWNHVIARAPGRNTLTLAGGRTWDVLLGEAAALSVSWDDVRLQRVSLSLPNTRIQDGGVTIGRFENFTFHIGPVPDAEADLRVAVDWTALQLPAAPARVSFLGSALEAGAIKLIFTHGAAALDSPDPLLSWMEADGRLDIAQVDIDWGPLDLQVAGEVGTDVQGRPKGSVRVRLERADELKAAMATAGLLTEDVRLGIDALALMTQGPQGAAPFVLRDGGLYFSGQRLSDASFSLIGLR